MRMPAVFSRRNAENSHSSQNDSMHGPSDLHHYKFWNRVPGCNYPGTRYPVSTRGQDINYDLRGEEGVDGWVNYHFHCIIPWSQIKTAVLQFCEYGLALFLCCFS